MSDPDKLSQAVKSTEPPSSSSSQDSPKTLSEVWTMLWEKYRNAHPKATQDDFLDSEDLIVNLAAAKKAAGLQGSLTEASQNIAQQKTT